MLDLFLEIFVFTVDIIFHIFNKPKVVGNLSSSLSGWAKVLVRITDLAMDFTLIKRIIGKLTVKKKTNMSVVCNVKQLQPDSHKRVSGKHPVWFTPRGSDSAA